MHVDGSTDGSLESLLDISDERLKLSYSENLGFGPARAKAFAFAAGKYTIWLDDDDKISPKCLATILNYCRRDLPPNCAGYVFHVSDIYGKLIGDEFNLKVGNLFQMRFDSGISGDKKEMVLTELWKNCQHNAVVNKSRLIPTSLLLGRLSLEYEFLFKNCVVAQKDYLPTGLSKNITKHLIQASCVMSELQLVRIKAFHTKRYKNKYFYFRSVFLYFAYILLCSVQSLRHRKKEAKCRI